MKQLYYAVKSKNDNIRINSSSGGIFFHLAKKIIEDNGVVYGAIYDENFKVIHHRVDNSKDLTKFFGSKYAKSDLNNCFEQIKKDIKDGKKVMFSGTPCQIKALKNQIKSKENLFLVDIICHGTPNPVFLEEYKTWLSKKYNSKIIDINMRYKKEREFKKNKIKKHIPLGKVEPHIMNVKFANKKEYSSTSEFDPFYILFDNFTTKGCFSCPFSSTARESDITIGDFHEFSSKLGDFNDGNGVSLVIINTENGLKLFSDVESNIIAELKTKEECIQPALQEPMKKPTNYDAFNKDFKENGFDYVVKKYTNKGVKFKIRKIFYKIGILDKLIILKRGLK